MYRRLHLMIRQGAYVRCAMQQLKLHIPIQEASRNMKLGPPGSVPQGWREVIEAVFSEEADRRRQVVRFREASGEDDRERKVCMHACRQTNHFATVPPTNPERCTIVVGLRRGRKLRHGSHAGASTRGARLNQHPSQNPRRRP